MTKAILLPVEDAFILFREQAHAGNFHDYDFEEIIRSIIDTLTKKPSGLDNIRIPFISTSFMLKTESGDEIRHLVSEADLEGINSAIFHLTFALLNLFQAMKLYDDEGNLTTTHFMLDAERDTLVVYPSSFETHHPNET